MPVNYNFLKRIRVINTCLAHSAIKYWSKERLIDKIEEITSLPVGARTLDSDINKLRHDVSLNYNAPIKFSKENNGYYYSDRNYSIDNIPLTEKDIETMEFAATLLSQFQNVSIISEFSDTIHKIVGFVNHLKHTNHETSLSFIDFEKATYLKGTQYLNTIIEAVKNRHVLEVTYKKFDAASIRHHVIHPYLLKEYKNRWYLLGLYPDKEDIITLALDRMLQVDFIDDEYIESKFDFDLFFENTIGINYQDKKPKRIVLSFTSFQGNYIKTQHIHKSQKILVDNENEFRVELNVIPNFELKSMIMSYCENVKVISPKSLRIEIQEIISKCHQLYN